MRDRSSPETHMGDDHVLHETGHPAGVLHPLGTTPLKSSQSYATVRLSEAMAIGKTMEAAHSLLAIGGERSLDSTIGSTDEHVKASVGEDEKCFSPQAGYSPFLPPHLLETQLAREHNQTKSPSPACPDDAREEEKESQRFAFALTPNQVGATPAERGTEAMLDHQSGLQATFAGCGAGLREDNQVPRPSHTGSHWLTALSHWLTQACRPLTLAHAGLPPTNTGLPPSHTLGEDAPVGLPLLDLGGLGFRG